MPLPQQEVGAHGNRQGFIVSSVALLFEEQDVEMLHCRGCNIYFINVTDVALAPDVWLLRQCVLSPSVWVPDTSPCASFLSVLVVVLGCCVLPLEH